MHRKQDDATFIDLPRGKTVGSQFLALVLLYSAAMGVAAAAACPTGADIAPAWIALGGGSCTLPDGSVVSNFRYSMSVTGNASQQPLTEARFGRVFSDFQMLASQTYSFFSPPGSITSNFGYTLTPPPGSVFNAAKIASQGHTALFTAVDTIAINVSLCLGGTFSSFPPGTCSGTPINLPPSAVNPNGTFDPQVFTGFAASSSVNVFQTFTFAGGGGGNLGGSAAVSFQTAVPPPPGTPAPPSLILTGIGICAAGLYWMKRKRIHG